LKTLDSGIVAFAFGAPGTIWSNQRIAEIASEKALEIDAPVFTQADVRINKPGVQVKYILEKPGGPPPTLRIARGALRWARQKRLTTLWIAAAEPHLWRVLRDMEEAAREGKAQHIDIAVCAETLQYQKNSWFCSDSTQAWTRSRKAWERRERILMLLPFSLYKLVAN